ncbi:MAG: hypothetical protein JWO36_2130 [Myxococcales bacterium]|nr:hypothetical protein [Myxococcales bacterium]
MSSERGRVVLIFAAVAVIGGAAAYYFFKIYQPKQALEAAQGDIAAWDDRYIAARRCLLGPTPASSKTSEALAMREMSPDPWDRGGCTPLISKLSRGDAPQTGIADIEQAWGTVDHAATKAAQAFALHVGSSTTLEHDPLPSALDTLDAARVGLRAAAKLPAAEQAGKALQAAQIIPIMNSDAPITKLEIDALPSAHGIVLFGNTASREVEVALTAGGAPQVGRVAPGSIRAAPDTSWGATAGQGSIRAGAFDAEGAMPTPTTLPLPGTREVSIAAAGGTPTHGVVVYGGDAQLAIAHAHEGSITADSPLRSIATGITSTDADGRVALVWTTADRELHARILKPTGDEPIVELTDTVTPHVKIAENLVRPLPTSAPCLTGDRGWVMFGTSIVSFGGGKPAAKLEAPGALLGCTLDAALVRRNDTSEPEPSWQICTDTCRTAKLPGAPTLATIAVVGGKLVAVAAHGSVLAVWHEDAPPTYFGLPEAATPVLAHEWGAMGMTDGKVLDVIARGDKTFVVIRIPAAP